MASSFIIAIHNHSETFVKMAPPRSFLSPWQLRGRPVHLSVIGATTSKVPQDYQVFLVPQKYLRIQVLLVPQKYFGMTRYFKYFKSTHRYPNLHDHYRGSHHQTATEAHHGQHLGPPGHLHHVRHGAQSLPWEVPCFKSRSSGWISIEIAMIDCFRHWYWCKFRWHWQ